MRKVVATVVACFSFASWALSADSQASIRHATHIPEQALDTALQLLAKDRNLQMIYPYGVVGERRTRGAHGELTFDEAIKQLLVGTELTYRFLDERTVTIEPAAGVPAVSGATGSPATATSSLVQPQEESGSWLKLAQASNEERESQEKDGSESSSIQDRGLQEIVVTAQKRTEKLRDVPMSIGVQTAADLEKFHAVQFDEFSGYIAGLTVANLGFPGTNRVMMRGLGFLGGATPLVSTYLDDSPVGGVIGVDYANAQPDINPYDVERVEILRGPQGTLWGASSIAGMVRYVTAAPDLHRFSARSGADLISVSQSNQLGYGVRGMVNVPLVEGRLGLRLTGSRVENPGYIDNLLTGKKDENGSTFDAGGLGLLWQATDNLTVKLQARLQRSASDGFNEVSFGLIEGLDGEPVRSGLVDGELTNLQHILPYSQMINLQRHALNINWQLGFADLFSTTAYSKQKTSGLSDATNYWRLNLLPLVAGISNGYAPSYNRAPSRKIVQELRLASPDNRRVEWLAGMFYNDEKLSNIYDTSALNEQLNPVANAEMYHSENEYTYTEWAFFGNATYKFSSRFDVAAGLRWAKSRQMFEDQVERGAYFDWCCGGGQNVLAPSGRSQESAYSYALSSRYHFKDDAMVYARIATGFRPGGPNRLTPYDKTQVPDAPSSYKSDTDVNYELGLKADYLDRRVQLEASVFRINLSDIPALVEFQGTNGYIVYAFQNAGKARSDGIELALDVSPTRSLHVAATTAYSKAIFLDDQVSFGDKKGDLIPGAPQWTGSLLLDYTHRVSPNWQGVVSGGVRYQSKFYWFSDFKERQYPMDSLLTDLSVALSDSQARWRIALYARNLFDERVYGRSYTNAGQNVAFGDYYFEGVNQPRTVGLSVDRSF